VPAFGERLLTNNSAGGLSGVQFCKMPVISSTKSMLPVKNSVEMSLSFMRVFGFKYLIFIL
jgi:hypothetical protein